MISQEMGVGMILLICSRCALWTGSVTLGVRLAQADGGKLDAARGVKFGGCLWNAARFQGRRGMNLRRAKARLLTKQKT